MKSPRPQKKIHRLSEQDIEAITGFLDGWTGKLTWELLVDQLQQRWKRAYTRQALDRHTRIKEAFVATKARLRISPVVLKRQGPVELGKAMERIQRLESENDRLKRDNSRLTEQFIRWAYNAHIKGFTEAYLNQPLTRIDREPTKL